jgi:hypothetical protein
MTERNLNRRLGEVAQKWRDLAARRHAYYVDMQASGRWQKYYTEEGLMLRLREAAKAAEQWAEIAPYPPEPTLRPRPPRRLSLPPAANIEAVPEQPGDRQSRAESIPRRRPAA